MTQTLRARPTMYAGIQMRSRLEAEPLAYADTAGTYLPDFEVTQWEPTRTFVEVKPEPFFRNSATLASVQKRMEIILSSIDYCPVVLVIWDPERNRGYAMKRLFHDSDLNWIRGKFGPLPEIVA